MAEGQQPSKYTHVRRFHEAQMKSAKAQEPTPSTSRQVEPQPGPSNEAEVADPALGDMPVLDTVNLNVEVAIQSIPDDFSMDNFLSLADEIVPERDELSSFSYRRYVATSTVTRPTRVRSPYSFEEEEHLLPSVDMLADLASASSTAQATQAAQTARAARTAQAAQAAQRAQITQAAQTVWAAPVNVRQRRRGANAANARRPRRGRAAGATEGARRRPFEMRTSKKRKGGAPSLWGWLGDFHNRGLGSSLGEHSSRYPQQTERDMERIQPQDAEMTRNQNVGMNRYQEGIQVRPNEESSQSTQQTPQKDMPLLD